MSTMASAAFSQAIFSVLATDLRAEYGVSRWQIGALVSASLGVGAILSPTAGRLVDQMLPERATSITLIISTITFGAISLAQSYFWLIGAALIGGIGPALANAATNRMIVSRIEAGHRGLITGVKQSGVQLGAFAGGLFLPVGAGSLLGWRGTVAAVMIMPVSTLLVLRNLPDAPALSRPVSPQPLRLARPLILLTGYALAMGLVSGALITHIPSFAQERFGWSTAAAGTLATVFGGVGFVSRMAIGHLCERWKDHARLLQILALLTAGVGVLLASASLGGVLWLATALMGLSAMTWNAVANFTVIELLPESAGRASGIVMAGFFGGVAMGAPGLGFSVDLTASYIPGWLGVAVLAVTASITAELMRRQKQV